MSNGDELAPGGTASQDTELVGRVGQGLRAAVADIEPSVELDRRVAAVLSRTRRRPRGWAVPATAAAVAVAVAVVAVVLPTDRARDHDGAALVVAGTPARHGLWSTSPPAPARERADSSAVWTGDEFVVWGGRGRDGAALRDGVAYEPESRTWRAISEAPAPMARHLAVWTGSSMVVIGTGQLARALEYDVTDDKWRRLDDAPPTLGAPTAAAALDGVVLAVGATGGAVLDPEAGWRSTAPPPREVAAATALCAAGDSALALRVTAGSVAAARYSLAQDAWTVLPGTPVTGTSAVVCSDRGTVVAPVGSTSGGGTWVLHGDTWTSAPAPPLDGPAEPLSYGWTGSKVLVAVATQPRDGGAISRTALVFDPATATWYAAPPRDGDALFPARAPAVTTRDGLIIWDGVRAVVFRE